MTLQAVAIHLADVQDASKGIVQFAAGHGEVGGMIPHTEADAAYASTSPFETARIWMLVEIYDNQFCEKSAVCG